jgi:hypothetical protein
MNQSDQIYILWLIWIFTQNIAIVAKRGIQPCTLPLPNPPLFCTMTSAYKKVSKVCIYILQFLCFFTGIYIMRIHEFQRLRLLSPHQEFAPRGRRPNIQYPSMLFSLGFIHRLNYAQAQIILSSPVLRLWYLSWESSWGCVKVLWRAVPGLKDSYFVGQLMVIFQDSAPGT